MRDIITSVSATFTSGKVIVPWEQELLWFPTTRAPATSSVGLTTVARSSFFQLLSQIKYQNSGEVRDIGNAMRFVARNIFKRTSAGANVQRVAVFLATDKLQVGHPSSRPPWSLVPWISAPQSLLLMKRVYLDGAFGVSTSLGNVFIFRYWYWQNRNTGK